MGANVCSFTVKGKDREALTKNFWKQVKAARREFGDRGYTGSAAEFSNLTILNRVFLNHEELDAFIESKGKNDAYLVQVKVIKDSPTIERWLTEAKELSSMIWRSNDDKFRQSTRKTLDKIYAKIQAARARKAEASKRTEWVAIGWVAE